MRTLNNLITFLVIVLATIVGSNPTFISAANTCTAISFPNGSKISWGDPTTMSQYWPALQQVGDVVGTYPWSVSLCDATVQAAGAMSCAKGNYMAQNPDCSFMFKAANTPTIAALGDGTGVAFTFAPVLFTGNTWSAAITCVCDPNRDNLYLPSGNYKAAVSGTSGNVIALTWNFQSRGCCIDGSAPPPGPGGDNSDSGSGGLTWGGVFLLIFFLPLGLYVIGFVAWNYKQGKTGKDLAPHPEFWGALPSLAKDGIMFIVSKIRGTPFVPSESGSSSSSSAGATGAGGDAGVYTSV